MHPVVVNGSRDILKVAPGQNATAEAEDFCVMHGVPMDEQPGVVEEATEQAERRAARDIVLTVPIDAPDGRKLQLELREGEQHEIGYAVQIFAEAMRLGAIDVNALANVVLQRLPAPIMTLPVHLGGQLQLRVTPGANVTLVVSAFAQVHALDD